MIRNLQIEIQVDNETGAPLSAQATYLLIMESKTYDVTSPDWSLSAEDFYAGVRTAVYTLEGETP